MKVVIAGAGSMGLLLGSFLAEAGIAVSFFTRRQQQATSLCTKGLTRMGNGESRVFRVGAFSNIAGAPRQAVWILSVKSGNLAELVEKVEHAITPKYVLFIQNGLRHLEIGIGSSFTSVGVASLTHGAERKNDTTVIHRGEGVMGVAHVRGATQCIVELLELTSSSFQIKQEQNAHQMLLRKAIINCCINPLTTLLRIPNGLLIENESAHQLMKLVYSELAEVYPDVTPLLRFSDVEEVCRLTSKNRSSMLTDFEKGDPMEIDTIVTAAIGNQREKMPVLTSLELMLKTIDVRENNE